MGRKSRAHINPHPIMPVGGFAQVMHFERDPEARGREVPVVVGFVPNPGQVDNQGRGGYTKTTWRPWAGEQ